MLFVGVDAHKSTSQFYLLAHALSEMAPEITLLRAYDGDEALAMLAAAVCVLRTGSSDFWTRIKTGKVADQQRQRVEGESADINQKVQSFQASAAKAEKLASGFEGKTQSEQKRLDDLTHRYDTSLTQISRSVIHTSVTAAFPNLDQQRYVEISPVRFDVTEKKPNEKWINLCITPDAMAKHIITGKNPEKMASDLTAAGFTVLPGPIAIGGPGGGIIERAGSGPYDDSAVIYFRTTFKDSAEKIAAICSSYITLPPSRPQLSDSGEGCPMAGGVDIIRKDGKLDAQIFIGSPRP
jgi:hypothetical protein